MQNFVTVKGKKSSHCKSSICHLPSTEYFHICMGDRASCHLLWPEDERMSVTEFDEVSLRLHTHKKCKVLVAFTPQICWTQAHSYMTLRADSHTMSSKKGPIQPHSATSYPGTFKLTVWCEVKNTKNHIFKEKSGSKEQDL